MVTPARPTYGRAGESYPGPIMTTTTPKRPKPAPASSGHNPASMEQIPRVPDAHGVYGRKFATLAEFMSLATQLPADSWESNSPKRTNWTFGSTFTSAEATARALADGQTSELTLRIADEARTAELARIETSGAKPTRRRRLVWSDAGDEISVDRMLADHDQPWRTTRIGRTAPIVKLGVCITQSCGNAEAAFASTIGKVAAAADVLISQGFGVEIVGFSHVVITTNNRRFPEGEALVYSFTLKSAEEPMDMARVCSVSAPGLLRAFVFRLDDLDLPGLSCHGYCRKPSDKVRRSLDVDYIVGAYWISKDGKELSQVEALGELIKNGDTDRPTPEL